MNPVVVVSDMITAYGRGIEPVWRGLLAGRSALASSDRIEFPSGCATTPLGLVPGILRGSPAVLQMLEPMLRDLRPQIPSDTLILLATTLGDTAPLESAIVNQSAKSDESDPSRLLERVVALCGTVLGGHVISAACASSTIAIAHAAELISSGAQTAVLVVACDAVSEFVYAGFATMNALDAAGARPFDRERQGLNLGEAAAVALLMSESRARREDRTPLGIVAGWGMTNDATHVTRPDPTGAQLARASLRAIERAGLTPGDIDVVSAHGTGTRHNDNMELAAFQSIFPHPLPVFSIKGGLGHTLGAAGLLEILLCFRALDEGVAPPTVGLREPDELSLGWVSSKAVGLSSPRAALTTNSGFGGINAALVLTTCERNEAASPPPTFPIFHASVAGVGWITQTAYGCMRERKQHSYAGRTTARLVGSVDALFRHKIESFGRFDEVSRMTCYACALALRDAGIAYSQDAKLEIGLVGVGHTGSLSANRAYFKDYVESGRILARGNLFVYTLPTAPLGEAAIHFGFQGPLFAVITPSAPFAEGLRIAHGLVAAGDAPAMLVVQADADCALAAVLSHQDSGASFSRLAELSASHPELAQLIAAFSLHAMATQQSA